MTFKLLFLLFNIFHITFIYAAGNIKPGQSCAGMIEKCVENAYCQQNSLVCRSVSDKNVCVNPNPCDKEPVGPGGKTYPFCVPSAALARGFTCFATPPTGAPTPAPPSEPVPPTPVPIADIEPNACVFKQGCTAQERGTVNGCDCAPGFNCTGTDLSGRELICNKKTNVCYACIPGDYACKCKADGTCFHGQCNPEGLCLEPPSSCTSTGGSTCPCDENVRCRYDLACSVTSGQCQICPRGCGVECAAAAKGLELGKDDDVCQVWPDCDSCVSNACTWCDGVCASRCPAGVLPSPRCEVSCSGVFDCNQGGECIDTDVCECFAGFLPDTELGCLPITEVDEVTPEDGPNLGIIIGCVVGGIVCCAITIGAIIFMKNRSNDDYSASSSTTGGIGGIDYGAPADGKFRCNFEGCGKEYDFQSDLDTHTTLRHGGDGDFAGAGYTFGGSQGGYNDGSMGYNNGGGSFNGYPQGGGSFNGGSMNGYANNGGSMNGYANQGYNNGGGSFNGGTFMGGGNQGGNWGQMSGADW